MLSPILGSDRPDNGDVGGFAFDPSDVIFSLFRPQIQIFVNGTSMLPLLDSHHQQLDARHHIEERCLSLHWTYIRSRNPLNHATLNPAAIWSRRHLGLRRLSQRGTDDQTRPLFDSDLPQ